MRYLLATSRYLLCLILVLACSFPASTAFFVQQPTTALSSDQKLKIYEIITKNRYVSDADVQAQLPKSVTVRWVPDTLYQLLQLSFFQPGDEPKNAPWEKASGSGNYFDKNNKLDKRNEQFTRYYESFFRLNNIILEKKLYDKSFNELLDTAYAGLATSQINSLAKLNIHVKALQDKKSLFARIIKKEEEAHKEGAFLLWRYTNGISPFLDLVIDNEKLYNETLEIVHRPSSGLSYAYTILSGIINDSVITPHLINAGTSACSFSYLITNELAPLSLKKEDAAFYSIKIHKKDLSGDKNIVDHYVYLPALSFDQDIFGRNEMFHPRWILNADRLNQKLQEAHESVETSRQKVEEDKKLFICDHLKRMAEADVLYIGNKEFLGDVRTLKPIKAHQKLKSLAKCID